MDGSFEALLQRFPAFTPGQALAGGLLIGLAACVLLGLAGRVAGISGIVGRWPFAAVGDRAWRGAFVAGLLLGTWGLHALCLGAGGPPRHSLAPGWLILAGLLVGYGTALGGGCTSGHGVCGLGLRSLRSLVATAVFLAMGLLTTYVARHLLGLAS
jgi:uncharacterized membrane protein YedE/YeeE